MFCFHLVSMLVKVSVAIAEVILPRPPQIPQPSRWTKLFGSLDFWVIGLCCCNLLTLIIELGWTHVLSDAAITKLLEEARLHD